MTDEPAPVPTVADRLAEAGLSPGSIRTHLEAGRIRLDGEPVTDLQQPAPRPMRPFLAGD